MQACLEFILSIFSRVYEVLNTTVFTAWGFSVSYFWILVGLTFMGFLFTVLLPFASRAQTSVLYSKARSERNNKKKGR